MAETDNLLRSIDAKLSALLSLVLDGYVRDTAVARPKPRSVDRMLADAGLSAAFIGRLLGKTERAVHLQLQNERQKKASRPKKTRTKKGSE